MAAAICMIGLFEFHKRGPVASAGKVICCPRTGIGLRSDFGYGNLLLSFTIAVF